MACKSVAVKWIVTLENHKPQWLLSKKKLSQALVTCFAVYNFTISLPIRLFWPLIQREHTVVLSPPSHVQAQTVRGKPLLYENHFFSCTTQTGEIWAWILWLKNCFLFTLLHVCSRLQHEGGHFLSVTVNSYTVALCSVQEFTAGSKSETFCWKKMTAVMWDGVRSNKKRQKK